MEMKSKNGACDTAGCFHMEGRLLGALLGHWNGAICLTGHTGFEQTKRNKLFCFPYFYHI